MTKYVFHAVVDIADERIKEAGCTPEMVRDGLESAVLKVLTQSKGLDSAHIKTSLMNEAESKIFEDTQRCHRCGCDEIEGGHVEIIEDTAQQFVSCAACGRTWNEVYHRTGVTITDEGEDLEDAGNKCSV